MMKVRGTEVETLVTSRTFQYTRTKDLGDGVRLWICVYVQMAVGLVTTSRLAAGGRLRAGTEGWRGTSET